jgi:DnaJ-class molecular chaperone
MDVLDATAPMGPVDAATARAAGSSAPTCSVAEMVALQAEKPCSTCRGNGRVVHWPQASGAWMEELCQRCGGTGKVRTPNDTLHGSSEAKRKEIP